MVTVWMRRAWDRLAPEPDPQALQRGFFDRYAGRSLIVHEGFPEGWLGKLVHEPGGGGHFRIDATQPAFRPDTPARRLYPVQWLVREHILPLDLPRPVLVKVEGRDHLRARHLRRHGGICDPAEVGMILGDMTERPHVLLYPEGGGFSVDWVLDPEDNLVDTPYGLI
ncbi:hypothetical protein [Thiohalorhabdus denitrificans]|uniref:Uncharacterized protein n=1 Tax=Thiohalorhabdus denitrificans TaxID=381306 RepID=A0A1G5GEW4_9GAMM|nr:hypothetical protein [Thiohalorhabdus denitrificans]SCY50054.1 hypothetical protein SAMN05661077_2316 [Thiohalorhabdus denitrificans]